MRFGAGASADSNASRSSSVWDIPHQLAMARLVVSSVALDKPRLSRVEPDVLLLDTPRAMMRTQTTLLCFVCMASVWPRLALGQEKVKLAVLPAQFDETAKGQVPDLFDDYLLTAVQNESAGLQVIGQEDISAILGFEQQKDLFDCADTSCMADIGGALGVDRIVVVKIARLNNDWVTTAKLINIRAARVESRVNQIVSGSVKNLLESVGALAQDLFAQARGGAALGAEGGVPSASSTDSPRATPVSNEGTTVSKKKGGGVHLSIPIVLVSVGTAAVLGGLVAGLVADSATYCGSDPTCVGAQAASELATDAALAANLSYGFGGAAIVAGAVLFFFVGGKDKEAEQASINPIISPHVMGLSLSGRF